MKYRTLRKLSLIWALLWLAALMPSFSVSQIKYDTLVSKPVGPGIVYTRIYVSSVPWNINVLEVDLKNPFVKIETAKGQDLLTGFETTSSMANRNTYDGHFVVGAVNGDFFGDRPINVQVKNGEILRRPIDKSTLGFNVNKYPSLSIVSFNGSLITSDTAVNINGVNEWRYTDALILYNSYMGSNTGTNQWGTEVKVHPLGEWFVNDTVACVVDTIVGYVGNMSIPKGGAVLSGHGVASTLLSSKLHKGDTVKIALYLTPSLVKLKEMLGGFPKIVFNGLDYVDRGYAEEGGPSHTYERHPRTGAGISADSSKLYLITVDGRQAGFSVGMTLKEFAALMIHLGVYHGINFDGGGSTTMVVRGSVVNKPSDPTERRVTNALLVVSTVITSLNEPEAVPYGFELYQNYPNPFNPTTTIEYRLSSSGFVSLKVYDVLGREVATLVNERQKAGTHTVIFDASRLLSGVYFCRLVAGSHSAVKKMLMIK